MGSSPNFAYGQIPRVTAEQWNKLFTDKQDDLSGVSDASGFGFVTNDTTLAGDSASLVASEHAVKAYADNLDRAVPVADRSALKALDTTHHTIVYLGEAGREGIFAFRAGDYSTLVTNDAQEGLYVKATAIASTAGAWVRQGAWGVYGCPVEWFGGDTGSTAAANTTAIEAVHTMGYVALLGLGTYNVNPFQITKSHVGLKGITRDGTILNNASAAGAGALITVTSSATNVHAKNFWITRTAGVSTTGDDGIVWDDFCEYPLIEDVRVSYHWRGFVGRVASFSKAYRLFCDNNYSHGIAITNENSTGGLQWTLVDCLSQQNDGLGFSHQTSTAAASCGDVINPTTYANKLGGMGFYGSAAHPLQAPRVKGGFFGQDGADEFYLDTYSTATIEICNIHTEIAGTSACGVNLGTAATNVGRGVNISANNNRVVVSGVFTGHSYEGVFSDGSDVIVRGDISGCGAAAHVGNEDGIIVGAGSFSFFGRSNGNAGYGLLTYVDTISAFGDLSGNTSGAVHASGVTLTNSKITAFGY